MTVPGEQEPGDIHDFGLRRRESTMRTSLRRLLLALAFAYPFAYETTWASSSSAPSPSEQIALRQAKPAIYLQQNAGQVGADIHDPPSEITTPTNRGLAPESPTTSPSTLSPAAGLTLTISTKRSRFWTGEPIRVDVAWSASQRTEVMLERGDFCAGSTRLIVDDGSGQAAYEEQPLEMCEGIGFAPLTLAPGAVRNTTVVFLGNGSYDGAGSVSPLFTKPGEYRLRLAYSFGGSRALSNVLDLSVELPQAEDLGALDAIRSSPRRFFYDDGPTSLARYPESRYLEWTRLMSSDLDAETWRYATDHEERDRALRRIVADLLKREWRQFEDGALRVAYLQAWTPALSDLRDVAATRIRQGYPDLARNLMGGPLSPDK